MSEREVLAFLGSDCDRNGYGPGYYDLWYLEKGIFVSFDDNQRVTGVGVLRSPPTVTTSSPAPDKARNKTHGTPLR